MARACVALGSNRGDGPANFEGALAALDEAHGVRVVSRSTWRRTAPVGGPPGQADFLNGVVVLETELEPLALLDLLQQVELGFGRERAAEVRWGPRTLDLDLLLYEDLVLDDPRLSLPHPRLEERAFVLEPLAELLPELCLPGSGLAVVEALGRLAGPSVTTGEAER